MSWGGNVCKFIVLDINSYLLLHLEFDRFHYFPVNGGSYLFIFYFYAIICLEFYNQIPYTLSFNRLEDFFFPYHFAFCLLYYKLNDIL